MRLIHKHSLIYKFTKHLVRKVLIGVAIICVIGGVGKPEDTPQPDTATSIQTTSSISSSETNTASDKTAITSSWQKDERGQWYQKADGTYPKATWELIDGTYYYFDDSGYMAHDTWVGNYYLDSAGKILKNAETPDGYYVNEDGVYTPSSTRSAPSAHDLGNLPTQDKLERARVVRVVDGDTIVIDRGQGHEKVRLVLVDTPETVHPKKPVQYYGREASAYTKSQLSGRYIYLEKDVSECDKYGRLLRYVWLDIPQTKDDLRGLCFNAQLLLGGYAHVYTYPPDIKYVDEFRVFQREAQAQGAGLWGGNSEDRAEGAHGSARGSAGSAERQTNASASSVSSLEGSQGGSSSKFNPKDPAYLHAEGKIIGNTNSMKYHVPSGKFYKKVSMKNAVFFNSEEEARAAGYRRAKV